MKEVVKLLKSAMKQVADKEQARTDLQLSKDAFELVLDGSMEISAQLAMKLEQVTGVDAHQLLSAQAADQLTILGHKRIEKAREAVKVPQKGTSTDGRPSQSPMYGEKRSDTGRAVG